MNHDPPTSLDNATRQERSQRTKSVFNKKREHFLQDLIRSLDLLVYAELSAVYYMDCSFTRFVLRAVVQFMFLTPKPAFLPEPPANRPFLGAIFGANVLCVIFHVCFARPEAGEATRGYLHGGLAMDFVGQKGPTSKFHLALLDLLILVLQLVTLAAQLTRQRLKQQSSSTANRAPTQDHNYEERGQHRTDHEPVDPELNSLNPDATPAEEPDDAASTDESSEERRSLLASTAARSDANIFDAFNSGEIMIADLNLFDVIKSQIKDYRDPAPDLSTSPSATSGLRARFGERGMLFRMRVGDRMFQI